MAVENKDKLDRKKSKLRPKFGKMKMQRSRRPNIQRKEVAFKMDQDRLDFLAYLGHLSEEEEGTNQKWASKFCD